MPEGQLEKVMLAFAGGETEVLVCTTIIESGLDIPNANTIIIDRADTLGLAQLYQLRGRVGRSSRRAYAYLLYRRREKLSDVARKRLQAIFNASELGAGFQIALSDLEIRGAGNILGAEQHGHVAAVGFDLYTRLLAEAVEEQKAEFEGRPAVVERPAPPSTCRSTPTCRTTYVPETAQKLELYRRLGRVRTAGELAAFRQELVDRFGPLPQPVLRLLEVVELRMAAENAGIASISREEGELVVRLGTLSRAAAMRALARWAATSSVSARTRPASGCRATPPGRGAWPSPWSRASFRPPRSSAPARASGRGPGPARVAPLGPNPNPKDAIIA
jgi:transcription-repair coupling factor (superfamily II helicase)